MMMEIEDIKWSLYKMKKVKLQEKEMEFEENGLIF